MKPVCLVLSGGGARGFAHIGALRALEEFKIPIGKIIGTSMGAVVGGLYAITQNTDELEHVVFEFCRDLPLYLDLKHGVKLKYPELPAFLNKIYRGKKHANLPIPLGVVAADFTNAQVELLDTGDVVDNVLASISVPFLNPPYAIRDKQYFDAGLICNFPLDFYDRSDGPLIGVNVGSPGSSMHKENPTFIERLTRRNDIYFLIEACLKVGKVHEEEVGKTLGRLGSIIDLEPQLEDYSGLDFKYFQEIIGIGYSQTIKQRERILETIS